MMDLFNTKKLLIVVCLFLLSALTQAADQLMLLNPYLPDAYLTLRSTNKQPINSISVQEGGGSDDLTGADFTSNTLTTGLQFGKHDFKWGRFNTGVHFQVDQFELSENLDILDVENKYFYTLLFPLKGALEYGKYRQQIQIIPGLKTDGKYLGSNDADIDLYYVGQYVSSTKRRWVFGLATYGEIGDKSIIPIAGIQLLPGNGRSFYLTYPRVLMIWRLNPMSYAAFAAGLSEERWNDNVNEGAGIPNNLREKEVFVEGRYGFKAGENLWMKVFFGVSGEREFEFTNSRSDDVSISPDPALYMGVSAQYRPYINQLKGL